MLCKSSTSKYMIMVKKVINKMMKKNMIKLFFFFFKIYLKSLGTKIIFFLKSYHVQRAGLRLIIYKGKNTFLVSIFWGVFYFFIFWPWCLNTFNLVLEFFNNSHFNPCYHLNDKNYSTPSFLSLSGQSNTTTNIEKISI